MTTSTQDHWNKVYRAKAINTLGWYEETPAPSIQLLAQCDLDKAAPILEVGAGATTFVDHLLDEQYTNVAAIDISAVAMSKLQARLGPEKAAAVKWVVDDLTAPQHLPQLGPLALWHDRAVLHFLVAEEDRQTYFSTLRTLVQPGGYVIIAAFALGGASMCSGLEVRNYDSDLLAAELGAEFALVEAFDYTYERPDGDLRPYVYTLFQRSLR